MAPTSLCPYPLERQSLIQAGSTRSRNVWMVKLSVTKPAGYMQNWGADYDEIFAPGVQLENIWTLLALANNYKLSIHHADARNAFLNATVKQEM